MRYLMLIPFAMLVLASIAGCGMHAAAMTTFQQAVLILYGEIALVLLIIGVVVWRLSKRKFRRGELADGSKK